MAFEQPLPQSLSPSRLSDFQACPRRYQHGSIDRLPPARLLRQRPKGASFTSCLSTSSCSTRQNALLSAHANCGARPDGDFDAGGPPRDLPRRRHVGETPGRDGRHYRVVTSRWKIPLGSSSEGVELASVSTSTARRSLASWIGSIAAPDGTLTIVDYKTGSLPNRNYDSQTFANAELYAALCEAKLGEKASRSFD